MIAIRRLAAGALVVITLAVATAGPAGATTPTFTGGAQLAPYTGNRHSSVSASSSGRALAVWEQKVGSQYDIYGATMSSDTTQVNPAFPIATGSKNELNPDVAWNGTDWLVAWEVATTTANHDIKARRFAVDGDPLGGALSVSGTTANQTTPALAGGSNQQFFVAWRDNRNAAQTGNDIYGRRIAGTGQLLDGAGLRLSLDTKAAKRTDVDPDVAWNGKTFLTVWVGTTSATSDFYADQRRPDGTRMAARKLNEAPPGTFTNPAVASNGGSFMAVTGYGGYILGFFISGTDISHFHGIGVSGSATATSEPAIAYNGRYLVAWIDRRNGDPELWGGRLLSDGTVLDGDGFLMSDYYAVNASPALTSGASRQTYTLSWDPTPTGEGSGVVTYGLGFPAT